MSPLLVQISHLSHSFHSISLFDDISLSIHEEEIFALIGENGSGKTTLLQILAGALKPETGEMSPMALLTIGYLPQEIVLENESLSAKDYLEEGELTRLEKEMSASLEKGGCLTEWSELHEKYERLGGYRRFPIEKILHGLKLEGTLLDLPMSSLSSGQRVRVALAKSLFENPDLLLLDEPTNHLDQEMLDWLEKSLRLREGSTIVVSHDRKFLNAICNRLIEIKKGKLTCYRGNYDVYLEEQKRILDRQLKAYEEQEEEKALIKQKIKAMTFSKGKPPPPKDRNVMAYDRRGEHHQRSVQHHLTALKGSLAEIENNRLSHPRPKSIKGLRFDAEPLGSTVAIELNHMSKTYEDKKLFFDLTKTIGRQDRILVKGGNGTGKTTLLKCILGLVPLDKGEIRYAPSLKIGYLDQEIEWLPMEWTPLQYFESKHFLTEEELRRELHKAAIGEEEMLKHPFKTLSVGQRKRLMLLSLMLLKPNVLLLDEPTNHLDFLTLEAFEAALLQFEGALLAVSHDTTFLAKMNFSQFLQLGGPLQ